MFNRRTKTDYYTLDLALELFHKKNDFRFTFRIFSIKKEGVQNKGILFFIY